MTAAGGTFQNTGRERNRTMKYYIKAKNIETGETMIMSTPVYTDRKKAQEFVDLFTETFLSPVGEMTVVREDEK